MASVRNFGRNLQFSPKGLFAPSSAQEVLDLLGRLCGKKIRAIGALHSWSDAPLEEGIILDLRNLNDVRVERRGDETWAILGGGCRIKHAVRALDREGLALPTLGLITQQAVAGAAATGTHGSGRHSVSHYVDEITIAHYDQSSGEPTLTKLVNPTELRTARCALGCCGVVVSLGVRCRSQYQIEEHFRLYSHLAPVMEAERDYPLQQFYLIPHSWQYLAQHRRETAQPRSLLAGVYQAYWFSCVDLGLHLSLLALVRFLRSAALVKLFYRRVALLSVARNWRVRDKSQRLLTMEHELFRHIEIEVFVQTERLEDMLAFAQDLLRHCAGEPESGSGWLQRTREAIGEKQLETLAGAYVHHYPICVRKILPDDTTLSMASGDGSAFYSLSFISYAAPRHRASFMRFAKVLADASARLFDARPHWGKICPIESETISRLYPELKEFRATCRRFDRDGVFSNDWCERLLFDDAPAE